MNVTVGGSKKFMKFYSLLLKTEALYDEINDILDLLKEKPDFGNRIKKKQLWPKCYVDAFDVKNLFRLELSKGKRIIYSVYSVSDVRYCNVLEIFLNHKEYEKRFGY